eukprot:COSAG02_NODE_9287_length_2266_cov_1.170743_2_plen_47_part_00
MLEDVLVQSLELCSVQLLLVWRTTVALGVGQLSLIVYIRMSALVLD